MTPDLPIAWRRRLDLFEIGFVFLFLPAVVSTMDQPPFHLGALLLLWIGVAFLARGVEGLPDDLLRDWRRFRFPWAILWVAALAGAGALAGFLPNARTASAILLPLDAALFSVPLCFLAFGYASRRFSGAVWMPPLVRRFLPVVLFAGLHVGTASWKAVAAAFVGGWVLRKLPLGLQSALHGIAGAAGIAGGLW